MAVAADLIAAGRVTGWYQGRSEWGPRALGNRSILANPAIPTMKETLNTKIKRRESFRQEGLRDVRERFLADRLAAEKGEVYLEAIKARSA